MLTVLLLWYFNSPLYQHSNTRDCGRSPHDLAYGSVRQVSRRPIFHFQGPSSCSCRRFYLDSTFVPHIRDSFPESRCGRKPYQHRNFVSLFDPLSYYCSLKRHSDAAQLGTDVGVVACWGYSHHPIPVRGGRRLHKDGILPSTLPQPRFCLGYMVRIAPFS